MTLTLEPIERFEPEETWLIRKETGLTQVMFVKYMGVSVKTVEAWEAGRNHPEGGLPIAFYDAKRSYFSAKIRNCDGLINETERNAEENQRL